MEKHRLPKDNRSVFIDINAYQKGRGSEGTCATNAWDKLTFLNLTTQFTGVTEDCIKQWCEGIEELRDMGQKFNNFMKKDLFKDLI